MQHARRLVVGGGDSWLNARIRTYRTKPRKEKNLRPLAVAPRTLIALACPAGTAGTSHAGIIQAAISPDATILQLPQRAATDGTVTGFDPVIGQFTFTSANRLASLADTDMIIGTTDFEELSFRAADPGVILGLSFRFDTGASGPVPFAEVVAI